MATHINLLPPEITLAIFRATIKRNIASISAELYLNPDNVKALITLGNVCQSWRNTILDILCFRHYISGDNPFKLPKNNYLGSHEFISANAMRVRYLTINIDTSDLVNNRTFQLLESPAYSNICYSSATSATLTLMLTADCCYDNAETIINSNAARVTRILMKLAPNLQKVSFAYINSLIEVVGRESCGVDTTMIEEMSKQKTLKSTSISISNGLYITSLTHRIANLTKFSYIWDTNSDKTLTFIRANSQSLQEIMISKISDDGIEGLIKSNDSEPVAYPYLTKLRLWSENDKAKYIPERRPTFGDAVPFPRLQDLAIDMVYPFGDDVLFRGNISCLRYLEATFDEESMFMITKSMRLSGDSFRRLAIMKINTFINDIDDNQVFISQHTNLLMSARHSIERIGTFDCDIAEHFILHLDPEKPFQNVRALHLELFKLSLHDIFTILKTMPAVQIISSGIMELPDINRAIVTPGWLERLQAKYGILHNNIQHWRLHFDMVFTGDGMTLEFSNLDQSVHYSIVYSSILAILCPNFRGMWITANHTIGYLAGIRKRMDEMPFSPYRKHLEKLLGIGSLPILRAST